MSTGAAFVGLHPKQAFIVAGSVSIAREVATGAGWKPKFGNALTWLNGSEPVRYVDDAKKLQNIARGKKLYLGPSWAQRIDFETICELIEGPLTGVPIG